MIVVNKTDLLQRCSKPQVTALPEYRQRQSVNSAQGALSQTSAALYNNNTLEDVSAVTSDPVRYGSMEIDKEGPEDMRQLPTISLYGRTMPVVYTSLTQSLGLDSLLSQLTESVKHLCADPKSETLSYTQSSHRNHLTNCVHSLGCTLDVLDMDVVMAAENLRLSVTEIGQITGVISSEEVLDVLFKDFCIGK